MRARPARGHGVAHGLAGMVSCIVKLSCMSGLMAVAISRTTVPLRARTWSIAIRAAHAETSCVVWLLDSGSSRPMVALTAAAVI